MTRTALAILCFCSLACPTTARAADDALPLISGGPGELVTRTLDSPASCPMGLAWDGERLWIADRREDRLYAFDALSGSLVAELPSPGFQPTGLAWDGQCLWCADQEDGKLFRIEPDTGLVVRTVDAPWPSPTGLAWDGERLWVADERKRVICLVDPADGTTIRSFPAPSESPQGLAFDGRTLWCSDRKIDKIHGISPRGGEVLITLHSPGPYPTGLACDGENHIWSVDYQTDLCSSLEVGGRSPVILVDDQRHARITVTTDVLNYGPDLTERLEIYLSVPSDLPGQRLLKGPQFTPQPTRITGDRWGQEVAVFEFTGIEAGRISRVEMEVEAMISRTRHFFHPDDVGPLVEIPPAISQAYLVDDAKFDLQHPRIRALATELTAGVESPYWIARNVFHYLIDNLEYELAGGWNTAPAVLERGNGSCSEYTFCFIALCRASGLPARYAGSVVVRGDDASYDDVFHRWAEVYLPRVGWVPVDPSGGDCPLPADQANYFGQLSNRFLITTHGGGGSEYLGWDYNGSQQWTTRGKARIRTETVADWEPLAPKNPPAPTGLTSSGGETCSRP
jgi:transglutaminase-like putative cysteine protease/sugar lactone lactonase YvrE